MCEIHEFPKEHNTQSPKVIGTRPLFFLISLGSQNFNSTRYERISCNSTLPSEDLKNHDISSVCTKKYWNIFKLIGTPLKHVFWTIQDMLRESFSATLKFPEYRLFCKDAFCSRGLNSRKFFQNFFKTPLPLPPLRGKFL